MTRKSVLVLGANGRMGQLLRAYWRANPPENLDIFWVARRHSPGVTHVWSPGDHVDSLPQCNAIFGLWGTVSGSADELRNNISLSRRAHELARACGADRVIHASTMAIYRAGEEQVTEADIPQPRNEYGRAKLAMEEAVAEEVPQGINLRIANAVGAGPLFNAISQRDVVEVDQFQERNGPLRSFIRPSTLAKVIERLIEIPVDDLPTCLNVADSGLIDMADLVLAAGKGIRWRPASGAALPKMEADLSLMHELLGPIAPAPTPMDIILEWQDLRNSI